jgi:HK97 family phage portal protein
LDQDGGAGLSRPPFFVGRTRMTAEKRGLRRWLWPRREEKQSQAASLVALSLTGRAVWTPRDYERLTRQGFARNAVAYRCVRMIAEAAASVPWTLFEGDREIAQHPLLDLLARPNPADTGASMMEQWYGFLQTSGNAYLEAASVGGEIRELYALRPDRMKVVPGAAGWPQAYEYSVGGKTARYARAADGFLPVLHMKLFNPLNDHYGMSPLEAAATAIDIHNASADWGKALLDNGARPSGALVYKGSKEQPNLTDQQFARLKEELQAQYQGAENAGRPLLLEGGLEWQPLSFSPGEMDFSAVRYAAAREIALAFGVPPMLLGIPGDATYNNYREANLAFWRQSALPLVARTAQALTNWLKPRFGGEFRLSFDPDGVDALNVEREALWSRVGAADYLTTDEKRMAVGYGALEET